MKSIYSECLAECAIYGYLLSEIMDLMKIRKKDRVLIPIVLKYLKMAEDNNDKQLFVRCLGVKGFHEASMSLMDECERTDDIHLKWAIGNTMSIILDPKSIDRMVEFVKCKEHGIARQMFIVALGKLKSEQAIQVLRELLDDQQVCGHVIMALGYYKQFQLVDDVKPFLNHKVTWIRNEAKKTVKKLSANM
jgi:HEAT repeat protein